jgi:hypothetical protein
MIIYRKEAEMESDLGTAHGLRNKIYIGISMSWLGLKRESGLRMRLLQEEPERMKTRMEKFI